MPEIDSMVLYLHKAVLHHLPFSLSIPSFPLITEEPLSSDQPMVFPAQSSNATTILPKSQGQVCHSSTPPLAPDSVLILFLLQ